MGKKEGERERERGRKIWGEIERMEGIWREKGRKEERGRDRERGRNIWR